MSGARLLFSLLAALAVAPGPAAAAALGVSPMRLDLPPDRPTASLTVRNNDSVPVMIQVQPLAWPANLPTDQLGATRDLIAVPVLATIPPGGQQVVRVALRARADLARELTYRLLVSEVPQEAGAGRSGVRFALRFSLPVFVTPLRSAPAVIWSLLPSGGGYALEATNRGNAHLQVQKVQLGEGAGARLLEGSAYLLAGTSYRWPLGAPPAAAGRPLTLRADTDLGEVRASVAPAGG